MTKAACSFHETNPLPSPAISFSSSSSSSSSSTLTPELLENFPTEHTHTHTHTQYTHKLPKTTTRTTKAPVFVIWGILGIFKVLFLGLYFSYRVKVLIKLNFYFKFLNSNSSETRYHILCIKINNIYFLFYFILVLLFKP
jgi:hypothetical protein